MTMLSGPAGEAAALRRLVELLVARPAASAWEAFESPVMRRRLAVAYFLADATAGNDVELFMARDLERLLQHLTRRTDRKQVEYEGQVRGRVQWSATYKARLSQGYNPTRHVCAEVRHRYDTLENQLVKFLVERIAEAIDELPAALGDGVCYRAVEAGRARRLSERTDNMELALQRFRRHACMREVTLPLALSDAHERQAALVKLPEYGAALRLLVAYQRLLGAPSLAALRPHISAAASSALLLPARAGDEAEPWLRLAAELIAEQLKLKN